MAAKIARRPGTGPANPYTSIKRDTYAIWFSHLPPSLADRLRALDPGETFTLLINEQPTVWARMRHSATGPTPGVRIVTGRQSWERIPIGEAFNAAVPQEPVSLPKRLALRSQLSRMSASKSRKRVLFDAYEFADFSGAKDRALQRRAIRLAVARGDGEPRDLGRPLTRDALQEVTIRRLEQATRNGIRVAFGRDHQYSIPAALAEEIGLGGMSWRQTLSVLVNGTYGGPALRHISEFAQKFNDWLASIGHRQYFYSCTKACEYRVPGVDPRPSRGGALDPTTFRLTESCELLKRRNTPKPLNRVGDNGTVGGQTVVGLILLDELLLETERLGIPVAIWPFEGIDICSRAYSRHHVMFEPYPSAVRDLDVVQTDWNDAVAGLLAVQGADRSGELPKLLALDELDTDEVARVKTEGWIFGHRP